MKQSIRLFLLMALLLNSIGSNAQKIYLVSVGVNVYDHDKVRENAGMIVKNLHQCVNDAKAIAWVYQQNKRADIRLLTDEKATAQNVIATMQKMYAKATEKDIIVFFFSGHGSDEGSFICHDNTLKYDAIRKVMALSRSKRKMIFADACHAGAMRQNGSFSQFAPNDDMSKVDIMLFLASRGDETSVERPDMSMKNGEFTAYLQRGLKGGADKNRDRIITARELYDFVSDGVQKLALVHGSAFYHDQHPVMWGNFNKDMPVISW